MTAEDIKTELAQKLGYASYKRYASRCNFIFSGISLRGKQMLDVGCGRGALAIWAGLQGAKSVLGIEPESDGSTSGTLNKFRGLIERLGLDTVRASSARLEELDPSERFDVIVLYNVINHIDEDAVQALDTSSEARSRYEALAVQMRERLRPGGVVILADCGRSNLWGALRLRSPFAPTITWRKHQDPPVWIDLFRSAGFRLADLRWSPLYPLKGLTANRAVQWLTASHFVLRLKA